MRYVVFTTKHHDGFCMFNTKLTDYKITDPSCPFHDDPRADVTKAIFEAFRAEGLWVGAYFSKPDWHSPDYWWPYFPPFDRNPNYEVPRYPERWERFVQFTHGQIEEIMTGYGKVDILWLDGGWVKKRTDEEIARMRADPQYRLQRPQSLDIRMDELAAMARRHQPGLIVVDRAVEGPHQNYLTPENRVPEHALPYPWESCTISGGGWSHTPKAKYMSVRKGVHLLVDIVAKGGNLLLNVAPGPDGTWQDGAYELLAGIGAWMDVNREAIYGSRARAPYKQGDVCVVNGAKNVVYAIVLTGEDADAPPPEVVIPGVNPAPAARIQMLGDDRELKWRQHGKDVVVQIPAALRAALPCAHAWALRIPQGSQ
jgi:alpha-L-fucosidase